MVVAGSVLPEIREAVRRQLGVAHRMLDVLVPEIGLERAGVVTLVGELESAGVSKHVQMDRERHLGSLTKPRDHAPEADRRHRRVALAHEHVTSRFLLALQTAQGAKLDAGQGMHTRVTVLRPGDVQATVNEVNLLPSKRAKFGSLQAVPVGQQDHGRVPVAVAVAVAGDLHGFNSDGVPRPCLQSHHPAGAAERRS